MVVTCHAYTSLMPTPETALVTGATEGIGRATAFALGRAGYRVGVCARTASKLDALVTELRAAGIEAAGRPGDVGVAADADAIVREVERALFLFTRRVLPGMRERRRGTIVNVASVAGKVGFVGGTAYAASKHAVMGFSRSLMLEVRRDHIRVVAVCPGSVATQMLQDQPLLPANPEKILAPEDVAQTILCSVRLPQRALVNEIEIRPTDP